MCRMLMAVGNVDCGEFVDSAILMSHGVGACHEYGRLAFHRRVGEQEFNGGKLHHYDGWGAIYLAGDGKFHCIRSVKPIAEDEQARSLSRIATSALVIHVRNASIDTKKGIKYVHPIVKSIRGRDLYFFHNGFAPDVFRLLGRSDSYWDSLELFDWLISGATIGGATNEDWEGALRDRLDQLPSSTTAANFILAETGRITVCNWFPRSSPTPDYYTMHCYKDEALQAVSSEAVCRIGPIRAWRSIANNSVLTYEIPNR
jgi:predicted glutamine amidotransferase